MTTEHSSPDTAPLLNRLHDFVAAESKRWRNCATGELTYVEVSPAGKLVQEAIEALSINAQSTLIPAGKQARFKNEKSWFAVFDWHNDPESFEYRTVYALTSTVQQPDENKEGGAS